MSSSHFAFIPYSFLLTRFHKPLNYLLALKNHFVLLSTMHSAFVDTFYFLFKGKHNSFAVFIAFTDPTFKIPQIWIWMQYKATETSNNNLKSDGLENSVPAIFTSECFPEIKSNPNFISSFFAYSFDPYLTTVWSQRTS